MSNDLLNRTVERMKASRERMEAEGESWRCDLYVARDGDDETQLDVVLIPGPGMMDNPEFEVSPGVSDTRNMALAIAAVAVPGFSADRLILTTDAYMLPNDGPEDYSIKLERLEKDFGGSINQAVEAGARDELGITDSMGCILIERQVSPDRLPVIRQRHIPYTSDGKTITWMDTYDDWLMVDDGTTGSTISRGYVIESLCEPFRERTLIDITTEAWAQMPETGPADDFGPDEEPFKRALIDLEVMRSLVRHGALVMPMIPPGLRAEFMAERLAEFAKESGINLISNSNVGDYPADGDPNSN